MNLKDFETLEAARAYEMVQPKMVSAHMMISMLTEAALYIPLKRMQDDDTNPFQNAMGAFFDPRVVEYNFNPSHPVGAKLSSLLDAMIAADINGLGAALTAVRAQIVALSSETVKPFENVTLHTYLTAKGTCPKKQVTPANGWLRITTTADTEPHSPVVWHQPFEGHFVKVGNMPVIEAAGEYILKVSLAYPTLWADDAYGVI